MAFDITSAKKASQDFFHPELTNCTILVYLNFDTSLGNNIELLNMGERASIVYVRSDKNITRNTLKS